jgi:hypothetical protein
MNDPRRSVRVSPLAKLLGALFYLLVLAVILLAITGAGVGIVAGVRAIFRT